MAVGMPVGEHVSPDRRTRGDPEAGRKGHREGDRPDPPGNGEVRWNRTGRQGHHPVQGEQEVVQGSRTRLPEARGTARSLSGSSELNRDKATQLPSDDDLDYDSEDFPDNIVVIGSQLVSRGITIEGLRTTYYVHEPNDIVNDSTIQNARWLGPLKQDTDLISIHLSGELIRRFPKHSLGRCNAQGHLQAMQGERHSATGHLDQLHPGAQVSKNKHMSRKSSSGNKVQIKSPWIGTDDQSQDSLKQGLNSLLEKYEPSQLISKKRASIGAIVPNVENKEASDFLRGLKVGSKDRARMSNLADRISTIGNKVPDSQELTS